MNWFRGVCAGEAAAERKGEAKVVASVTFLHQLNEVQDGLLLAGTADGALRVWRNYAHKAEQRLATAWQVGTLLLLPLTSALVIAEFQQTARMPDCSLGVTRQETVPRRPAGRSCATPPSGTKQG